MNITEAELRELLKANPYIKVSNYTQSENHSFDIAKEEKSSKFKNTRVFIYSNGCVTNEKVPEYGKPTEVFDSKQEYERYQGLLVLEKMGMIQDLERQKPLIIQEKFVYQGEKIRAIIYKADFMYKENGKTIIEDVKGFDKKTGKFRQTEGFNLKWKLLKNRYPDLIFRIVA